jgi:hypothetical protein
MKISTFIPSTLTLRLAGLTAGAGGIVSVAMVVFGGSLAMHLPTGDGFYLAAILGAGLAGLGCAASFGRPGWAGWLLAAVGAIVATLAGAIIGSTLIGMVFGAFSSGGLGIIAILSAAERPEAVVIWALAMTAVHLVARRVRATPAAIGA